MHSKPIVGHVADDNAVLNTVGCNGAYVVEVVVLAAVDNEQGPH